MKAKVKKEKFAEREARKRAGRREEAEQVQGRKRRLDVRYFTIEFRPIAELWWDADEGVWHPIVDVPGFATMLKVATPQGAEVACAREFVGAFVEENAEEGQGAVVKQVKVPHKPTLWIDKAAVTSPSRYWNGGWSEEITI